MLLSADVSDSAVETVYRLYLVLRDQESLDTILTNCIQQVIQFMFNLTFFHRCRYSKSESLSPRHYDLNQLTITSECSK